MTKSKTIYRNASRTHLNEITSQLVPDEGEPEQDLCSVAAELAVCSFVDVEGNWLTRSG